MVTWLGKFQTQRWVHALFWEQKKGEAVLGKVTVRFSDSMHTGELLHTPGCGLMVCYDRMALLPNMNNDGRLPRH